jgi:hypothetical protein
MICENRLRRSALIRNTFKPSVIGTNLTPIQANFDHYKAVIVLLDHLIQQLLALGGATIYRKVVYILKAAYTKDIIVFGILFISKGFDVC